MAKPTLTEADFRRSAKALKCEVPAIKAVAEVESLGRGFYPDGFPVILFERHIFRKYTQGRYNKSHPHLSGPAGNYGAAGQNQRNKFNEAFALNPDAAMKACSWGKFQIMGFNHGVCGFATVGEFVDAMKDSEGRQLDAFVAFVISNNLARYLRSLNWAAFANGYNGAGYRKNNYDVKMARAFAKYSKDSAATANNQPNGDTPDTSANAEKADITTHSVDTAKPPPIDTDSPLEVKQTSEIDTPEGVDTVTVTSKNELDVNVPAQVEGVKPYNEIGLAGTLKNDAKAVLPANLGLQTFQEIASQATGWPPWVVGLISKAAIILLVITFCWALYRLFSWLLHNWRENERVKLMATINTDITRKNVEFCEVVMKGK